MIIPLQNFVIIQKTKTEKSESGIILPEDADASPNFEGKIVARGEKSLLPLEVGDTVLYKHYGFDEIEFEKEKYLIGREDNIIAKV